ncbi:MAG: HAMP domain-containing protein [Armatimonadetes bacterium]|nr:HAMP domain-containing protein [Anaerolineae bacterium]
MSFTLNMTRQLTLILASFIFITATLVIVPDYLLLRAALQQQVALRVADAARYSTTLLAAERPAVIDDAFVAALTARMGLVYALVPAVEGLSDSFERGLNGQVYDGRAIPLTMPTEPPGMALVVLMPIDGLLAAEAQIIGALLLSTTLLTGVMALVGGFYIRSQVRPLRRLTAEADRLGRGDLATPISTLSQTKEVQTLAQVLEKSRVSLSQTLIDLSRAKEYSESLIRSISEGIITLDAEQRVIFFSEGAARILQIEPASALAQPVNALLTVAEDQAAAFADYIPPEGARRTVKLNAHDGQSLTLAVTRARQLEDGQTTIVLQDITDEGQHRDLQAYFLANVSHEFRTPLAGMKVSIELLLENFQYLSMLDMRQLLNSLHLSVGSLQNLIDNLLESSKIEANHLVLRRTPTEVNQIVGDAVRLVQPFLNRRQQRLTLDEPLTLPVLAVDRIRITQILVNLLSNASKYSPMMTTIDLIIEQQPGALRIAVADQGQGIPAAQRNAIFRRFVRLSNTQAEYGTGLGLAVVKAMTEAHGGQVGVTERAGGGAVFWFTLPLTSAVERLAKEE